jgi:hypothetical protein
MKIATANDAIKTTWNNVHSSPGRSNTQDVINEIKIGDSTILDWTTISQYFNKYFLPTVERNNTLNNNQSYKDIDIYMKYLYSTFKKSFTKIKINKITRTETENIINSLNASNSYGFDEISTKILKNSSHIISSPLTYIFNQALLIGTFPIHMTYSTVIPVYKKGDKQDISNYRPISLFTSFSKILEKMIFIRLYKHDRENYILCIEQFGFKENSSMEKAT